MSAQFSEEEAEVLRRMMAAFLRVERRARGDGALARAAEPPTVDLGPPATHTEGDSALGRRLCAEGVHAWGWKRDVDQKWQRLCVRCGAASPDVKEGS
jgi:hypothetical protein